MNDGLVTMDDREINESQKWESEDASDRILVVNNTPVFAEKIFYVIYFFIQNV